MKCKIKDKYVIVSDTIAKKIIINKYYAISTIATLHKVQILDNVEQFNDILKELKELNYEIINDDI